MVKPGPLAPVRPAARSRSLEGCVLEWPEHRDPRGALVALEQGGVVPFSIARVFAVYDAPGGQPRADHAHRRCEELLVALAGSVRVTLEDGSQRREFTLDRPTRGVHIAPLTWVRYELEAGSVLLVLCSERFDPEDYVSCRDGWQELVGGSGGR